METRNFYILIASVIIGMSVFWLSTYAFIILDIDPLHKIKNWFIDEDTVVITIKGEVVIERNFTFAEIKSDKYLQVKDQSFHIVKANGFELDLVYSGVSLWSLLEEENLLTPSSTSFLLIGGDGYYAETYLNLSLAENYPQQAILAYEQDGQPLFLDGPIRSVVNHSLIPDKATSHYWIQNLKTILIQ